MSDPASPHVEVAVYLLGKLEADEAAAFEAHLAGCPDCRRQLEEFRSLPELLATATPAIPLPDALRDRTLAAVRQAATQAEPAPTAPAAAPAAEAPAAAAPAPALPRRPWWRRRWLVVAVAAAVLVAALAVPGALLLFGGDGGEVTRLTLVAAEGGSGRGQVTVTQTAAGRTFDVRIQGLRPPAPGSLYELWAVHPNDTLERPQRVSLGTFTTGADGSAHLTAFTAAPADRFPVVGVTQEPVDGNPARTGPRTLIPGPSG
jgi:anti-sigma-K factor RskA